MYLLSKDYVNPEVTDQDGATDSSQFTRKVQQ